MTGRICGTGSCVPSFVMDNNDIAKLVDTSDEWIRERTGVERRHIAEEETTVSMAVEAGRQAVEEAGISPEEIDMILVATGSADRVFPCTACQVQEALGALGAVGFDLNAACSGFLFAYNTAQAYISIWNLPYDLIIGSESFHVWWIGRIAGTCILFGGWGRSGSSSGEGGKSYQPVSHSDGRGGPALTGPGVLGRARSIDQDPKETKTEYITMNGKDVFQFCSPQGSAGDTGSP